LYVCRNQRYLRVRRFDRVLSFQEGDERGLVFSLESTQNALIFSDSEHPWSIRLTQNINPGSGSNFLRNALSDIRAAQLDRVFGHYGAVME
jgi:hypothetical protein